jgi:hypothetical protein
MPTKMKEAVMDADGVIAGAWSGRFGFLKLDSAGN